MKTRNAFVITAGIGLLASMSTLAADRQVPTAPQNYLDMKNLLTESQAVVSRGESLYRKCTKCHGANGDGKGNSASGLEIKPTAFNAPGYLKGRADGQLFFILDKGSPNTDMDPWGTGSDANLSKDDIWSLIVYLRKTFTK
ncbi:MAG: cytochrome c [Rhodocyclaceae bacterium]|nr:cytochrome c [Rhodocyclaceae bacterium]